jgi:uncharacterized protein YkwD
MMLVGGYALLGAVIAHGSVVRGEEPTVPPVPPMTEPMFVDVDVECPDVAYLIVDGTTHSKSGARRKVRISRDEKRTTSTIVANWSEAGQDRRIERSVNLDKSTKLVFTLDDLNANEQQLLDLTNRSRANSGLPMLRMDPRLCRAARLHSANMARYHMMSHSLEGKSHQHRTLEAGYPSGLVAENICHGQANPQGAINAWLNSYGHRINMLSYQYSDLGVGIGYSSSGQPYYTQVFGR